MIPDDQAGPRPGTVWTGRLCWLVIAAFATKKFGELATGEPLTEWLSFTDLSPWAIAALAAVVVLVFRSPKILRSATTIEPNEAKSVVLSFLFVFTLMAAYFILRPVRDAMASDWSNTQISVLWNLQLVLSTAVVALYGLACSRVSFRWLVPLVYVAFAVSFVGFYLGATTVESRVLVDKGFYLWVSLFSLFHVSVFWSFMADLFNKEQSRRVFAFIAAGASAGAAVGPLIAAKTVGAIGTDNLMLVASLMLLIPIPVILYLQRLKSVDLHNEDIHADLSAAKIGGNPFAGFRDFFSNPYLLTIGAFILLYTSISSFVYFEQVDLLRDYSREERTAILATLSAIVNVLSFGLGLFATSRLVTRLGMPTTLALMPLVICAGLLVLALAPILTVLLVVQGARQAGNYGITRPAREMLFTNVDRETRFKSKPVIDVAVYRAGNAGTSIVFAWLTDGLGLGVAAMAAIGAGVAAFWAASGVYLGRVFNLESAPEAVHAEIRGELNWQDRAAQ